MTVRFDEVIKSRKVGACSTCGTYVYTLPVNMTVNIGDYFLVLGSLSYNLQKCTLIRMDNKIITISDARVGSNTLRVKFKKEIDKYKELFDIHLAAFVESEMGVIIEMQERE
jgi:hypothetical protein